MKNNYYTIEVKSAGRAALRRFSGASGAVGAYRRKAARDATCGDLEDSAAVWRWAASQFCEFHHFPYCELGGYLGSFRSLDGKILLELGKPRGRGRPKTLVDPKFLGVKVPGSLMKRLRAIQGGRAMSEVVRSLLEIGLESVRSAESSGSAPVADPHGLSTAPPRNPNKQDDDVS